MEGLSGLVKVEKEVDPRDPTGITDERLLVL